MNQFILNKEKLFGKYEIAIKVFLKKKQNLLFQQYFRMSFFRSEDMEYYKLIMPHHSAWNTLNYLGKYGLIHVMPNNKIKTIKPFAANIKTCDQDLLKIKNIQKLILQHQYGNSREFISSQQLVDLNKMWQIHDKSDGIERSRFLQVDQQINNIWDYQQKSLKRKQEIKENLNFYRQNLAIIQAGKKEYGDAFFQINSSFYDNPEHVSIFGLNDLEIKAIVVDDKNLISIKRAITRITRGNSFMSESKFKDLFPKTYPGEEQKNVLFIVYPSKKSSVMDKKVVKIIDIYCPNWSNYVLPQTFSNFRQKYSQLQRAYQQAQKLFDMNQNQNKIFLKSLQGKVEGKNINQLEYYKYYIVKERQIFCQLNQMKTLQNFLQADVFIRKQDVEQVMQILYKVGSEMNTPAGNLIRQQLPRKLPTYFRLNDFKIPAQQITNTYGTPKYKQANPSFFTLVTFPFLFGVMFGDIAHGSIAFLFGVYLLFQSSNSSNSIIRALFPYRYLITLMGFFAIYCGFIYNDFLSISLNLFGSCYNIAQGKPGQPIHKRSSDCVYPFGLDPTWAVSSNYLNYVNSLKMKISVIIAVVHMLLGVFVKASNAIYFKNKLVFIFQFIPQLVFMIVFFGYMDFLIVYKWLKNWNLYDPHAPSIITTMINLPLKVGKTDKCCGGQPLWGSVGNTSQDSIQFILLITGMICIPLMLLPKPIIQICTAKSHHPPNRPISGQDQPPVENPAIPRSQQVQVNNQIINKQIRQNKRDKSFEEEHDAGQIFVHQLIQTIQYVLGCISNTASYLRLWALSLAHSQLSQVFFQKTIESGLVKGKIGIPILLLAFPILASATFGVLLCMDSMQCFLHTLRLHWVQFQNKFYKGDGFQFQPMDFNKRVKEIVAKSA